MIKDIIQENENATPNSKQLAALKEYFPSCFAANGSFDLERFKNEIAFATDVVQEGYDLKFLGKSYAKLLASSDTTTVIQPNENHNSLPENAKSENIYISGDNLDGLKHLLKSYNGEIKCIYIDPPYNTGSDGFVYADNFNYNKETLQEKLSVSEEEADRILELTKRGSASHSAWLMFMYSRLLLARDLLKEDGVIFISIDDNEQANLKLICDDVFGEENFIETYIWESNFRPDNSSPIFRKNAEFIICIARKKSEIRRLFGHLKGSDGIPSLTKNSMNESILQFPIGSIEALIPSGFYSKGDKSSGYTLLDDVEIEDGSNKNKFRLKGRLTWGQNNLENELEEGTIIVIKTEGFVPYSKKKEATNLAPNKILPHQVVGDIQEGRTNLLSLFPENVFRYSKPINLIKFLLSYLDSKDFTVVDFFSGSGTTANAVLKLNEADDGNRKFITIQLPQLLSPEVDSQKIAYNFLKENKLPTTLDYIGIERIKKAAAKIRQEHPIKKLDLGFKHYILGEPNKNTLDKLENFNKAAMLADTTIMEDFGKQTILATWVNADGYGLTKKAEEIDLAGYTAYYIQKHLYLIDPDFTLDNMKALLSKYDAEGYFNPENLVLFGYSFPEWSINEMIEKNLRILNDGEKNLKINFNVRY